MTAAEWRERLSDLLWHRGLPEVHETKDRDLVTRHLRTLLVEWDEHEPVPAVYGTSRFLYCPVCSERYMLDDTCRARRRMIRSSMRAFPLVDEERKK